MQDNELIIYQSVVRGMREGVFTLDRTGHLTSVNPAAMEILCCGEDVIGQTFAMVFMGDEANDDFCQAILAAVYQNEVTHNAIVKYRAGEVERQLFMSTSYLTNGAEKIGVTAVINDITELTELRDAVRAMEKIRALNVELEKRNEFIKKTFGRYLSDEIVSTILDSRDGLEIGGKKQDVTVMFSDVRGFTALSEKMAPGDLIAMLNHYLECMIEIIVAHHGTILEFIGDAIVVVFGAPLESDTRDADAVACAIDMQCDMANVNAFNEAHGYPPIEMGIGIHSGDVVLGNIGSSKKTKYDIIGRNVNLASRIETYTVGGQILISDAVRSTLGDALVTGETQMILPKGVPQPIPIHEVLALGERSLPDHEQHFEELDPPRDLICYPLDGKHAAKDGFAAKLRALSEKEMTISCDTELVHSATVKIPVGDEIVYAKVVGHEKGRVRLHITSGDTATLRKL